MRATGSSSMRGSEVEGKTIEALTWLMEVERRMRFLVIENGMMRNDISASTFPGHPRCSSIPSCWVSMLRRVCFCSSLYLLSELAASFVSPFGMRVQQSLRWLRFGKLRHSETGVKYRIHIGSDGAVIFDYLMIQKSCPTRAFLLILIDRPM
jgi:hypothetical protein